MCHLKFSVMTTHNTDINNTSTTAPNRKIGDFDEVVLIETPNDNTNDSVTVNHTNTNQNDSTSVQCANQNVQIVLPKYNQTVKYHLITLDKIHEKLTILRCAGSRKGKFKN